MVFSSSLVKCAPEEFPTARRLLPTKHQDSQFDSSNGGFSFSIFRPPFWRRDTEEEESEEREVSVDEEREIWAAVMDFAGEEVSTESEEVPTHDVTAETVTPLKDVHETPLMTEETETSSETSSDTATDPEISSEDTQSEVTSETTMDLQSSSEGSMSESTSETAADLGGSSEGSMSETTSTETKMDVETDLKPEASESTESSESSVSELSDLSVDVHDEEATSTQLEEEPSVAKTEETEVSTSQTEELVDTKKIEKPSFKRTQEESVMRKTDPQTVELMTSSEPTSQQPSVATAVESPPPENNNSHHIGHNLKVVTWTLAGVCLSVVVIGNFLGIYFSYIKPRLHQSTL